VRSANGTCESQGAWVAKSLTEMAGKIFYPNSLRVPREMKPQPLKDWVGSYNERLFSLRLCSASAVLLE